MTSVTLDVQGKVDVKIFSENLQKASPEEVNKLIDSYSLGHEPVWHRFIKGAYNHPITWWIGLLQVQMQLGMWGQAKKVHAQIAANQLGPDAKLRKRQRKQRYSL